MSKLFKNFVGIDISKKWFDAALIKADDSSVVIHEQFSQKPEGFIQMQKWLQKLGVLPDEQTLLYGVYRYLQHRIGTSSGKSQSCTLSRDAAAD